MHKADMEIDIQQFADQVLILKILWGTDLHPLYKVWALRNVLM